MIKRRVERLELSSGGWKGRKIRLIKPRVEKSNDRAERIVIECRVGYSNNRANSSIMSGVTSNTSEAKSIMSDNTRVLSDGTRVKSDGASICNQNVMRIDRAYGL